MSRASSYHQKRRLWNLHACEKKNGHPGRRLPTKQECTSRRKMRTQRTDTFVSRTCPRLCSKTFRSHPGSWIFNLQFLSKALSGNPKINEDTRPQIKMLNILWTSVMVERECQTSELLTRFGNNSTDGSRSHEIVHDDEFEPKQTCHVSIVARTANAQSENHYTREFAHISKDSPTLIGGQAHVNLPLDNVKLSRVNGKRRSMTPKTCFANISVSHQPSHQQQSYLVAENLTSSIHTCKP